MDLTDKNLSPKKLPDRRKRLAKGCTTLMYSCQQGKYTRAQIYTNDFSFVYILMFVRRHLMATVAKHQITTIRLLTISAVCYAKNRNAKCVEANLKHEARAEVSFDSRRKNSLAFDKMFDA